jgi:hypothetical protein
MSPLLEQIYKSRGLYPQIVSRFENLESRAVQTTSDEPVLRRITPKQGRFVTEGGAP